VPSLAGRVDRFQRRRRSVGIPLAVLYKYFDDMGPFMAAGLTYYAFVAIFPILLLLSSILGFLLQDNDELKTELLEGTLGQFPIVGTQLSAPDGITGSVTTIVVGLLISLYGVTGLGSAAQNVLNTAWAVPRNSRLNPIVARVRTLFMMVFAGVVVVTLPVLSSLLLNLDVLDLGLEGWLGVLASLLSVAVTAAVFSLMMRYTTTRRPSFWTALPGGLFIAVGWHLLQLLGGAYVSRIITRATDINAVFALVLGLVALIYLASVVAVLGIEVSVVLRRRLYPRALLTPFTDNVELTEADRRAYDSYAKAQRHKGFQHVQVTFDDEVTYEPEFDTGPIPIADPGHHPKPDPEQAPAEPSTTTPRHP
jgi:membrane protein